jgi:hypothetical protein
MRKVSPAGLEATALRPAKMPAATTAQSAFMWFVHFVVYRARIIVDKGGGPNGNGGTPPAPTPPTPLPLA